MQTKFKDIAHYYLGTGLEMQTCINIEDNPVIELLTLDYLKDMIEAPIGEKPLLRSLDSLTKPITVKGYNDENSFVPLYEIRRLTNAKYYTDIIRYLNEEEMICFVPFWVIQLLCSWHFNIFNLPETEYIKID